MTQPSLTTPTRFLTRVRKNVFIHGLASLIFITSLSAQSQTDEFSASFSEHDHLSQLYQIDPHSLYQSVDNIYYFDHDSQNYSAPAALDFDSRLRAFLERRDEIFDFLRTAQGTLNKIDLAPTFDDMILGGVFSKQEVSEINVLKDLEEKMAFYFQSLNESKMENDEFSIQNQLLTQKLADIEDQVASALAEFKLKGQIRWLQMSPEKRSSVKATIEKLKNHLTPWVAKCCDQIDNSRFVLELLEDHKKELKKVRVEGVEITHSILSAKEQEDQVAAETANFR